MILQMRMTVLTIGVSIALVASCLAAPPAAQGPRMSDAELLKALDLEFAGMEAVAKAVSEGDTQRALDALLSFVRQREEPYDFGQKAPRDPSYNLAPADAVLRQRFTVVGIPHTFDGPVDWYFNPTTTPESEHARDNEWTWQLNRHAAFATLAGAYRASGDERYARKFAELLESWIRDCPVPEDGAWQGPTSPWRTIECGIRTAGSWATALTTFRSSPSVSDQLLVDWLKSWIEHGRYLYRYPTGRNWLTMEFNGLYHVGTLLPFAKDAPTWRTASAKRLCDE